MCILKRIQMKNCCAFAGLASTALVLSIAAPFGGNNWYYMTLLSPLAGLYYWQRGTRQEEVQASSLALLCTCRSSLIERHVWQTGQPDELVYDQCL
jgi:hypothetical protein